MSEYTVKHESRGIGSTGYSVYRVIAPDGKAIREFDERDFDYVLDAERAANDYIDQRNLAHYKQEIASLQEAAAEKDSVIEAQSEELGRARQKERNLHESLLAHQDCDLTSSRAYHRIELYCNAHHAIIYSEPIAQHEAQSAEGE